MTNPLPTREEVKAIVERLREAGFSDRVYVEDGRLMRQTADLLERLSERDGSERDSPQKAVIDTEQQPHAPRLPTKAQVNSACLSYRHDFGLLSPDARKRVQFDAREWLHAWLKEGIGCDRNEVIERCAAVVDQANREGPYQAIAAASRIRALKSNAETRPIESAGSTPPAVFSDPIPVKQEKI